MRIRFAEHLRTLRLKRGWTQEELAERADLAYRHVQRLESLKRPPPAKIDTLEKLANAFNISPATLLAFTHSLTRYRRAAHGFALAADAPPRRRAAKRARKPSPR